MTTWERYRQTIAELDRELSWALEANIAGERGDVAEHLEEGLRISFKLLTIALDAINS